jgi:hypothetical protein
VSLFWTEQQPGIRQHPLQQTLDVSPAFTRALGGRARSGWKSIAAASANKVMHAMGENARLAPRLLFRNFIIWLARPASWSVTDSRMVGK